MQMSDLSELTTILLLGGQGTRLRSVVSDRPKVMALVNGRPFLTILLDELIRSGIKKVVFSTGYKSDYIKEELGTSYEGLKITYSEELSPQGTGGGLRLATEMVKSKNYLVMNGDNFIEFNLNSFVHNHLTKLNEASILIKKVDDSQRFGTVLFDKDMKVKEFKEKDSSVTEGYINCGVYILTSSVLKYFPKSSPFSLELDFFPNITRRRFYAFQTEGRHLDIGTPQSYELAQTFFK